MSKAKVVYLCSTCGNESPRWGGQCSFCKEWNTLQEFKLSEEAIKSHKKGQVLTLQNSDKTMTNINRLLSEIDEFDRVVGGGLVHDSFTLLTGDPGVGKSTLAMQVVLNIAKNHVVLYFSGEESVEQISSRIHRLTGGSLPGKLKLANSNNLEDILATLSHENQVALVVIDSIQTLSSSAIPGVAGSQSQVKYCAESLMNFLKHQGLAGLLIGHVTKDGVLAGPQTLAHLVDTVLYLEGDRYHQFRVLRGQKNRFGSTTEIGMFEMKNNGMYEVKNPSLAFLEGRLLESEGSVIVSVVEGSRPFLVELQALTAWSNFGYPKRTASGIDLNRLHLMLAVFQKHCQQKTDNLDVFVNVVGGFKIQEPATDLALIMAIASSKNKKPVPADWVIMGEVGLSGEVRAVNNLEKRLLEAEKMGFTQAIIPQIKDLPTSKLVLHPVPHVNMALKLF